MGLISDLWVGCFHPCCSGDEERCHILHVFFHFFFNLPVITLNYVLFAFTFLTGLT